LSSVCLIDGTFELYRAYFGAPSRVLEGKGDVGAAFGLGRSLLALRKQGQFSHYAVAFDTVIESFRNDLFHGYKTGEGVPPDLMAQFPLAEQLTQALGFTVLSMVQHEADDGLASAAQVCVESGMFDEIWIASPDKDLMQCVSGTHVVTWDRIRKKVYTEPEVVSKLGVLPGSIPDYLALVGDTADGIPGVPGWGAKSASVVLRMYEHLEHIPQDPAELRVQLRGAAQLLQNLAGHTKEVELYRTLATLVKDAPVPRDVAAYLPKDADWAALEALGATGLLASRAESKT
jgi:5'-3' exonuclease